MAFVGMVAMAAKPLTKGHFALIEKAADENDVVRLFVSTGDRERKGEFPIYWKDMKKVWNRFIKKILPANVKVYFVPNPTTALFDMLIAANDNPNNTNYFQLYADEKDIKRYTVPRVKERTLARLFDNEQIEMRPLKRSFTQGVSGTQIRQALQDGDLKAFVSMLPEPLQNKGDVIYQILGGEFE